jgi:diphthine synthase
MLFLVGLGLGDERDITVKGLEAVRSCVDVWLESYTAILPGLDAEALGRFYGKTVRVADRQLVESGSDALVEAAKTRNVALLVVGDPFGATTHTDLWLRAVTAGVKVQVVHNASIMNAVGACGLQLYSFGQTVSIPLFQQSWRPDSFYDKIRENKALGLHTLCLLDIKVKEPNIEILTTRGKTVFDPPYFMTIKEAVQQILYVEEQVRHEGVISRADTFCVGVARVGRDDQQIVSGTMEQMLSVDFGPPLHALVIAGKVHPMELDVCKAFAYCG